MKSKIVLSLALLFCLTSSRLSAEDMNETDAYLVGFGTEENGLEQSSLLTTSENSGDDLS